MTGLQAERGGKRGEAHIEWRHLHLEPGFLLLVGKRLSHAIRREVGRIRKADLIMTVVGRAGPEPYGVDSRRVRPVFAFRRELGLMSVDAGVMIRTVNAGDMIERVGLRDRPADIAAMEDVGAADGGAVGLHGRIRLGGGYRPRLVEQIRIARDIVVAGFAAVGVGVNCDVTAARVEQDASVHAAVDRTYGGPGFYRHAGG